MVMSFTECLEQLPEQYRHMSLGDGPARSEHCAQGLSIHELEDVVEHALELPVVMKSGCERPIEPRNQARLILEAFAIGWAV